MTWAASPAGTAPTAERGSPGHPLAVAGRAVTLVGDSLRLSGKPSRPWALLPSHARSIRKQAIDHTETLIAIAAGKSLTSPGWSEPSAVYRSSRTPGSSRMGPEWLRVHIPTRSPTQSRRWRVP
jgi:hypothetical protein